MSCSVEPVFMNVTGYVPAAGTDSSVGLKPRSNASMTISCAATGAAGGTAAGAGSCEATAAPVGAGTYDQAGLVDAAQPARATAAMRGMTAARFIGNLLGARLRRRLPTWRA